MVLEPFEDSVVDHENIGHVSLRTTDYSTRKAGYSTLGTSYTFLEFC